MKELNFPGAYLGAKTSIAVWLLIFLAMTSDVYATTKCTWATGKLKCNRNQTTADNVEVKLYDWDGGMFWDPDDLMGVSFSDQDGSFRVEGCASDFGFWNDPDPYIKVFHYCKSSSGSETETAVLKIFVPETADFGTINLD